MAQKTDKYLEQKVLNAAGEELLMMLIDGAINFAESAKVAIDASNLDASHEKLVKAQRIMLELTASMRQDVLPPELYRNLAGLYMFVYFRFVNANIKKDKKLVDEGLKILRDLRETWGQAVQKVLEERSGARPPAPKPGTLNVQG